jgi:DNA-binding LytR/AlgR family response regulator
MLKPVSFDRFLKGCNKAWELYTLKQKQSGGQSAEADHFYVNAEYSLIKVPFNDILMVEALKDYIRIHFSNAKPLLVRMSMKALEEKLPPARFLRIHKSYIISIAQITSIRKNLVILGSLEAPVSDNYKEVLMAAIGNIG